MLASSQVIVPLAPAVVRLAVGDVAHRPLIGLDTGTYRAARRYIQAADRLLLVRADRITALERGQRVADSLTTVTAAELGRCRGQQLAQEKEFARVRRTATGALAQPLQKPWPLDKNTYLGVVLGAAGALFLLLH